MTPAAQPAPSESVAFKLHRATVLVDQAADMFLRAQFGISYSLFSVILVAGTLSSPNQRQIARALGVTRASITQRLAQLIEMGLVQTTPDEQDSRALIVHLTESGGALLAKAWQAMEADDDGIDRGVDTALLARELDTLIANATARIEHLRAQETSES